MTLFVCTMYATVSLPIKIFEYISITFLYSHSKYKNSIKLSKIKLGLPQCSSLSHTLTGPWACGEHEATTWDTGQV